MEKLDFPALYRIADSASKKAQRVHFALLFLNLTFLVCGAGLPRVTSADPTTKKWLAITGSIFLAAALLLATIMRIKRFDRVWYGGRAIAESAKTLAWKYMTRAEPYDQMSISEADRALLQDFKKVFAERRQLAFALVSEADIGEQLTSEMRRNRSKGLEDRKRLYLADRIQDQRCWYSKKAKKNHCAEDLSFAAVLALQLFAAIFALNLALNPDTLNSAPLLATVATALIAWSQAKRFQDLAQAYGVAAYDLSLVADRIASVASEQDFSAFVSDAENAISREHTLWIARRDVA